MNFISGKVQATPSEVGFDSSRLEILNTHLEKLITKGTLQGATYCISKDNKVFASGSLGEFSYKKDGSFLLPDTILRTASITKLFTAVAIMQLIENGAIRTDIPVSEILPQFKTPPFNKVNIGHLLTHTSGIAPDHGVVENKYQKTSWDYIFDTYKLIENKEDFDWIAQGLCGGMFKEAGSEWMYSSFGYVILGAIIEKITGIFADDYIVQKICEPLKMKDTFFTLTKEKADRVIIKNSWMEEYINKIKNGETVNQDSGFKMPNTSGGMFSTASDLVRFGNMLLQNGKLEGVRIMGRKTTQKMTTQAIFNIPDHSWNHYNPNHQYGLGPDMRYDSTWLYSKGTYLHEGAGACNLVMDPVENVCAAWFVPYATDGWHGDALYNVTNIIWSGIL